MRAPGLQNLISLRAFLISMVTKIKVFEIDDLTNIKGFFLNFGGTGTSSFNLEVPISLFCTFLLFLNLV